MVQGHSRTGQISVNAQKAIWATVASLRDQQASGDQLHPCRIRHRSHSSWASRAPFSWSRLARQSGKKWLLAHSAAVFALTSTAPCPRPPEHEYCALMRGVLSAIRTMLGAGASAALLLPAFGGEVAEGAEPGTPIQLGAPNACLANLAIGGCGDDPFNSFSRPLSLDVAPDGADVYVANQTGSIGRFRRDPGTNVLTPAGGMSFTGDELSDVFVASSGTTAVAAGGSTSGDGTVEAFTRNPSTGELTVLGCADESGGGGCANVDGIGGAQDIALAPSGPGVYVAGEWGGPDGPDGGSTPDGSIAALSLNTSTGAFSQLSCTAAIDAPSGACGTQTSDKPVLRGPAAVVVSPDGRNVYFGGFGGLVGYNRDPASGKLVSEAECMMRSGGAPLCPKEDRLPLVQELVVSADGEFLYAGGGNSFTVLDRNTATGTLSVVECMKTASAAGPCPVEPAFGGGDGVAATPDGSTLYVAGGNTGEGFLRAFRVDQASGHLADLSCVAFGSVSGCTPGAGIMRAIGADTSGDGTGLYVASYEGTGTGDLGALAEFRIEQAPPALPGAGPPAPSADKDVKVEILGKRVQLNRKGIGRLRMRCPASEQSPPCSGKVVLRTRKPVASGSAHGSKRRPATLASARFKIGAGATAKVKVKLGTKPLALLRQNASARKAVAIANVKDGAGNSSTTRKQLSVVPR
jgi:DNA-binding beta-propeller fold protein YncE